MSSNPKSPWVYIGCGCGVIASVCIGLAVVLGVVGFQTAKTLTDPDARDAKALEMLGADELPPGYEVELAISLPIAPGIVILNNKDRKLIFMDKVGRASKVECLDRGECEVSEVLKEVGIRVRQAEILDTGRIAQGELVVDYMTTRGKLDFNSVRSSGPIGGSATFDDDDDAFRGSRIGCSMVLRCEGERRLTVAMWSEPDPDSDLATDELDLVGGTADPEQIRELVSFLRICD
jgi:hypothetical protein